MENECLEVTIYTFFFFSPPSPQVCLTFCYTKWNFLLYHDHNRSGKYAQVSIRILI